MGVWPVPDSFTKEIPPKGSQGSFWEDRDEQFHCGIDIYAPEGAEVVAIEAGTVFQTGNFSVAGPDNCWNDTYYVIIKSQHKIFYKYAELIEFYTKPGDVVMPGQVIGKVGSMINPDKINYDTPHYIREILNAGNLSMLHLELYKFPVIEIMPYKNGNFLGKEKPYSLLDPALYLNGTKKHIP